VIARLYDKPETWIEYMMETYQINVGKVRKNVAHTLISDHLKTKDKTIDEILCLNLEMQVLQDKVTRIHKNSMIRDYLYQELNDFVLHYKVHDFLGSFGKTHLYVEECVEGMIRVTQTKIYSLYETFDNDRFRDDEMIENKGDWRENYYDSTYSASSEVNRWRVAIHKKVEKIRLVFMEEMEKMKKISKKMKREEFIVHPSYSVFFEEGTKKQATMKVARDKKQSSSALVEADSKKRKEPS